MAKLTNRKKAKPQEAYHWLPEDQRPKELDELKLEGFRFSLVKDRVFKVNTRLKTNARGWWKVVSIYEWPDGHIDVNAYWSTSRHYSEKAHSMFRACTPEQIKSITKDIVAGKGHFPKRVTK